MVDAEGRQLSLDDYTNHFLQQMNQAANQKAAAQHGVPTAVAAAAAAAASFRGRKPQDLSVDCMQRNRQRQITGQSPRLGLPPLASSPVGLRAASGLPFYNSLVPPCNSSSMTAPSPTSEYSGHNLQSQSSRQPMLPTGLAHAKGLPPLRHRSPSPTATGSCRPCMSYAPEDEFLNSPTSPKGKLGSLASFLLFPPTDLKLSSHS